MHVLHDKVALPMRRRFERETRNHHKIIFVVRCAICYNLYNLKNVKNTHGGLLVLLKLTLLKLTLLHGCFSHFLNCTNFTKLPNESHLRFGAYT